MKLPVTLNGEQFLDDGEEPVVLSPDFHLLLSQDAAGRGETERARAHEVLAEAVAGPGIAATAPQLLEAANEIQLPHRQLANFLAERGVTMGCFPVVRLSKSLTMGEIARDKPHMQETVKELTKDLETRPFQEISAACKNQC